MPIALSQSAASHGNAHQNERAAIAHISTASEGNSECIARKEEQRRSQRNPDSARPRRNPRHHERYRRYQVGMHVTATDMQFGKRALDAIVAGKIQQAGKYRALPNDDGDHTAKTEQHSRNAALLHALRLSRFFEQQRQQCKRPGKAFELPQTVEAGVVREQRIGVERRKRPQADAGAYEERRGNPADNPLGVTRQSWTRDGRGSWTLDIAIRPQQAHCQRDRKEQVEFVEKYPAAPRREVEERQEREGRGQPNPRIAPQRDCVRCQPDE